MAAASKFNSVVTNPGGTGSTITPTLSTHAVGDVIEIFVSKTGNAAWSAPAGWTIVRQTVSPGTASTATVGTILQRKVVSGDTLPLTNPTCTLGATVTRHAIARTIRGADLEGVYTLPEWISATASGTNNPIRPPSVTTPAPETFVTHYYCQRVATNAPEPTGYTQDQQVITSGTLVTNVSERTVADQQTVLSNQDASPTSGGRWVGMITIVPSPDYPYYRAGSSAFQANATSATPALPTGTSASDNRGNKELIIATVECAGTPTIAPNTPADWTEITEWANTTSGNGTTVRKYWAFYDGSLDRQFNRSTSGEIFVYFSTYRNAHQMFPLSGAAVQQNASSTSGTWPAMIRTSTKATIQLTCVADATPTYTTPSPWTERNDSQGVVCADQVFNATGTVSSGSFTLNSASPTLCGLLEVNSVASLIVVTVVPATTALSLSTFAPTLAITNNITVQPPAATLTLSTLAPAIIIPTDSPLTAILDTFNRANELPLDNDTWGSQIFDGDGDLRVLSNQSKGFGDGSGNNQGWLTQYGPDCEVYLEIVNISGEDSIQIFARLSAIGGSFDGYSVRARGGSTNNLLILRWDDTSLTVLATLPQMVENGDWFGLNLQGDQITVFYKDVSESSNWFQLGTVTDGSYGSAGHLGLYIFNSANVVDNFGGGTVGTITVEPIVASLTLTTFAPKVNQAVVIPVASLTLTTFASQLNTQIVSSVQTLTLTGFAPVVDASNDVTVTPDAAFLLLISFGPSLRTDVIPAPESLALATFTAQLAESTTPTTTSLALTTFAPSIVTNVTVEPNAASLTIISFAPSLRESATMGSASLSLNTFAPTVSISIIVQPQAALLALMTFEPSLNVTVTPTVASLVTITFAPILDLTPQTAHLTLSAFVPLITVGDNIIVEPPIASLTITTFASSIIAPVTVTPDTAQLAVTAFGPSLHVVISPQTETFSLTTSSPSLIETISPSVASLSITSAAPSIAFSVQPLTSTLTLAAFAPTVTSGGTDVIVTPITITLTLTTAVSHIRRGPTPPRRTFMVESARRTLIVQRESRTYLVADEDKEEVVI